MKPASLAALCLVLTACEEGPREWNDGVPQVAAAVETTPVATLDDAADDPAIWVHPATPEKSLILGTDKDAGLYAYDLTGAVVQFLPLGEPNNVDLRQGVRIGKWAGDLAAASNRSDDSINLLSVTETGLQTVGGFASAEVEPYGLCMGLIEGQVYIFVTHKSGMLRMYHVDAMETASEVATLSFASQLEGCVHDDAMGMLYIGEEDRGIWRSRSAGATLTAAEAVDQVGGDSGIADDVEGLAIYPTGAETGYLVASSQGNDSFAVYRREGGNAFIGRFRIGAGAVIDGAEETDGIAVSAGFLGPDFPRGLLVAQDGFNAPEGSPQNFKYVDWREIEAVLGLAP
ncbi:MAG: hypothetical protein Tsb0016_27200 [Sphingomonadales bacterium]